MHDQVLARRITRSVASAVLAVTWAPAVLAQTPASEPVYPADLDAPKLARLADDHFAAARAALEKLIAVSGGRTAANTLAPFDEAYNHGVIADGLANVAVNLHPDTAVRVEGRR